MNDVPTWLATTWFYLSSIFFLLGIVLLVGIGFAGIKVMKLLEEMKPKVDALEANVQGLVVKLHNVADRVEELTESVKSTVDNVGGHARGVAGSADLVAKVASREFERFSPWLVGTVTAMRLIGEFRRARHAPKEASKDGKPTKRGGLAGTIARALMHLAVR